jgi:arabinofuranosyltransferase
MSNVPRRLASFLPFLVALACALAGLWLHSLAARDVGKVLEEPTNGAMGDWLLGATQPGRWLFATGILLALLTSVREVASRPLAGAPRFAPWLAPTICIGGACVLALLSVRILADDGKHATLAGAGDVWWLDDDMMITLRYARNLVEGHGLVWNAGERVEGITNFLWALILAVPAALLDPRRAALGAIVLNGVLLAAAIAATFVLVRRLGGSRFAAALAAFALATHQGTLHWAAGGSEAILLALLLLAMAWCALGEAAPGRREAVAGALCGGFALLTRPDALPVVAVLLLALLARVDGRAPRLRLLACFLALPVAQLLVRFAYYGDLLPNTYYLKMTGWPTRPLAGVDYVVRLMSQHALHFAFAAAALLAVRRRATTLLFTALVLQLAYIVWCGGDELPKQRFFVPVAPLLFTLSLVGAEQLAHRIGGAREGVGECPLAGCQPLWLPWAAVAVAGIGGGFLPGQFDPGERTRANAERACAELGLLIKENTRPEAVVAHFWAGACAYFSERRGVDLLGKCDRFVARLPARPGLMKPGHNKYDFAHSLADAPDVIVGGLPGGATLAYVASYAKTSPYRCFADLYTTPGFAVDYVGAAPGDVGNPEKMPQFVGGAGTLLPKELADVTRNFHAIFVRRDSKFARAPAEWTAPK